MDIKNGYPLPAGMGIFDTRMLTGTGIIVSVPMDTRTR